MTNFDRIKAMSIDELAQYIHSHDDKLCDEICRPIRVCPGGDNPEPEHCWGCIKHWLESEVQVNG